MSYSVETDGVDHINVNSIGRTLLGLMLYNGAYSPFVHPEFGTFVSITGLWGWLVTGRQQDIFRHLYGEQAQRKIKDYVPVFDPDLRALISRAVEMKLQQNLTLLELFKRNANLPYVTYGELNREPIPVGAFEEWVYDDLWTLDLFTYLQAKYTK